MKILHTADWHLGRGLDGISRDAEQEAVTVEICRLANDEKVDLVLIAGDIFDSYNPPAGAESLFFSALNELAAGGRRGVVVIAGNHDSPERLSAVRPFADRLGISLVGVPKDELHIDAAIDRKRVCRAAAGPSWMELAIPGCGQRAVIAALPFPSEGRLREVLSETLDETDLQRAYEIRVQKMLAAGARRFRADSVNLVMSHLFVSGGKESESERSIQLGGAHAVGAGVFPASAHYVALGHLHRPQQVEGSPALARYSGSPLALSFSEAGQAKSVTLIEAEPGRLVLASEVFLSGGRPLARWVAQGIGQVEAWLAQGKDATAWIDLEIHVGAVLSMAEIHKLKKMCPRFVHVRPVLPELPDVAVGPRQGKLPIDELFRRFFRKQEGIDPDAELVRLFMELASAAPEEAPAPLFRGLAEPGVAMEVAESLEERGHAE